jgi:hypothetical protein
MERGGFTHDGGLTPYQVNAMKDVAEDLSLTADGLGDAHLSWSAFGLAGFGAALQYGSSLSQTQSDLRSAADAAKGIASLLTSTKAMYHAAEDANLRALLGQADLVGGDDPQYHNTESDLDFSKPDPFPTSWPDFGNFFFPNSYYTDENSGPGYPTQHYGVVLGSMAKTLGTMGLVGADLAILSSLSKAAEHSKEAATWLKVGGRLSAMVGVAEALYLALVVPSDEALDSAVHAWGMSADTLALHFGTKVETVRAALQVAWSGAAHDVADRKIRDFMTVGAELHEEAVRHYNGLYHVIDNLSTAHEAILATCIGVVVTLIGLEVASVWPPTAAMATAMKEFIGTQLTSAVIALIGVVGGLLEAFVLWLSSKGDFSAPKPPAGVPTIDGALKDLKQA